MSLIFLVYPVEGILVTDNLRSRMKAQLAIQRGKIPLNEPYYFITISDIANQAGARGGFGSKIMSILLRCDAVIFDSGWEHSSLSEWIFDTCNKCKIQHFTVEEDDPCLN